MSETQIIRGRGLPQVNLDLLTGTQDITITNAEVEKDGTAITLDPGYSATPGVLLSIEGVTEANSPADSAESAIVKSISKTALQITAKVSDAPGGATKTKTLTVRYVILGKANL